MVRALAARAWKASVEHRCASCGERFPPDYALCPRDGTPLGPHRDPADPLLGRVLAGSYRITRLLAKGGMGRLYEAEHTRLPRRLAIKVIHDIYAKHEDALARFEREARVVALVDSEHVVTVVDVVRTEEDLPCIVYERLEGEDLQSRLDREEKLAVADAVAIARQLCAGLAAAHAAGVIHRDLKPSNVFLAARATGTSTAKLLDFGVAKLAGAADITRTGAVVGTPAYMAPEQARGASDADVRADVYGVGAVLYRMLSGRAPFEASEPTASLARLLNEPVRPLRELAPEVPADLADLVAWATARDPRDRPASALELDARLAVLDPRGAGAPIPIRSPANAVGAQRSSREDTLVMPRGSVESAIGDAASLARGRPRAALSSALGALAVAALTACATGAALRLALDLPRLSILSSALVVVLALVVGALAGGVLGRRVRLAWSDPARLLGLAARTRTALVAGAAALGVVLASDATLSVLLRGAAAPSPSALFVACAIAAPLGALHFARR